MLYRKHPPCLELQPYVECYYIWDSECPLESPLTIESPPTGYCSIVFNYGDPYYLQNKKYERLSVPMQFVSGQSIYSYKLFLTGTIGIAGIVSKPTALATIFRFPMYELIEERLYLLSLFAPELVEKYSISIRRSNDEQDRVQQLEIFYFTR